MLEMGTYPYPNSSFSDTHTPPLPYGFNSNLVSDIIISPAGALKRRNNLRAAGLVAGFCWETSYHKETGRPNVVMIPG